jgi:hypothetical protein
MSAYNWVYCLYDYTTFDVERLRCLLPHVSYHIFAIDSDHGDRPCIVGYLRGTKRLLPNTVRRLISSCVCNVVVSSSRYPAECIVFLKLFECYEEFGISPVFGRLPSFFSEERFLKRKRFVKSLLISDPTIVASATESTTPNIMVEDGKACCASCSHGQSCESFSVVLTELVDEAVQVVTSPNGLS